MSAMKRNAIIGIVASALVVILIWYFAFYKPTSDDVSKTQEEVTTAQREQQALEATLARLEELDRNAPQQQATLQKLDAAIPSTPDLADFIFQANTAAADSGVDWVSIAPTPPAASTSGGPTVIALAIQVNGGFFQVLDYLNRLEDLPRLVVTDTISVAAGGSTGSATGSTTQTTLSTSTSNSGAPTLSVALGSRMFTTATAVPAAPGGTGTAPAAGSTDSTTTTVPAGSSTSAGTP